MLINKNTSITFMKSSWNDKCNFMYAIYNQMNVPEKLFEFINRTQNLLQRLHHFIIANGDDNVFIYYSYFPCIIIHNVVVLFFCHFDLCWVFPFRYMLARHLYAISWINLLYYEEKKIHGIKFVYHKHWLS